MHKTVLIPKKDSNGVRRCAWEGCSTALSVYNDNIVCLRHTYDYAINYLPTIAPRKKKSIGNSTKS